MGYPQVTIGFNTKMVIHDLDDLGVPPWIGNLHMVIVWNMNGIIMGYTDIPLDYMKLYNGVIVG